MAESSQIQIKPNKFWKLFIYLYVLSGLLAFVSYYFFRLEWLHLTSGGYHIYWIDILYIVVLIFNIAALVGYAYSKRVFHYWVWWVWCILLFVALIVYLISLPQIGELAFELFKRAPKLTIVYFASQGIEMIFSILVLIAIYRYAFESMLVWEHSPVFK